MNETNDCSTKPKLIKRRKIKIDYFDRLCKRMPKGVRLTNDSRCIINEDEYVVACSWIGLFKKHWQTKGAVPMDYIFIPISKRLNIDFGIFFFKNWLHDPVVSINKNHRSTVKYNEQTWLNRW